MIDNSNTFNFITAIKTKQSALTCLTHPGECLTYSSDNSKQFTTPKAVLLPTHETQLVDIVLLANQYQVPLIARGRGTGTVGGCVPTQGSVVISFERMTQVINVSIENRFIEAQAGTLNQDIQKAANQHGFFWAPDPSSASFCTIGGNLAHNSAGPRAVKYGTTRENTLGLTAITGDGQLIKTGSYTTKNVVGYDFTRLLIGSEGTLALISSAILKLLPLPEHKATLRAFFTDTQAATAAIIALMKQSIIPCALEFLDKNSLKIIKNNNKLNIPSKANAMLMIEIDGDKHILSYWVEKLIILLKQQNAIEYHWAQTPQEVQQLWQTRKALSPCLRTLAPNKINEDVVVPINKIPELLAGVESYAKEYKIINANFGHAGNGNLHINLLFDAQNKIEKENADHCLRKILSLVLKLDGSLSGEHGIGLAKRSFIHQQLSPNYLKLMSRIKKQFDPQGILNPGKIALSL